MCFFLENRPLECCNKLHVWGLGLILEVRNREASLPTLPNIVALPLLQNSVLMCFGSTTFLGQRSLASVLLKWICVIDFVGEGTEKHLKLSQQSTSIPLSSSAVFLCTCVE